MARNRCTYCARKEARSKLEISASSSRSKSRLLKFLSEITREVREDNALVREIMHTHTRYSKRLLINTTRRFKVTSDGWVMQTIMQNIIADELSDILSIKLKYAINGKISISTHAVFYIRMNIKHGIIFFLLEKYWNQSIILHRIIKSYS